MRIVDLFSGAGGLTFGFYYRKKANRFVKNRQNRFIFANEYDEHAAKAFSYNYPDINMINDDIRNLEEQQIMELIGEQEVDLIIGGPPCQSFSTVGQRVFDEKATLYEEYLRMLEIIRPKMFLFENVKGILSMRVIYYKKDKNGNIVYVKTKNKETGRTKKKPVIKGYGRYIKDIIIEKFTNINEHLGYNISIDTLNAVDYGVPENRERVFFVGIRRDLNIKWTFPKPLEIEKLSISDAISDLPILNEGEEVCEYNNDPQNEYQSLMRNSSDVITYHYCGIYGDKIRTVIQHVEQGQGKDDFNQLIDDGIVEEKYRLTSGYSNTYGRLVAEQPSTTITNNLATPSGLRCIHYEQNRSLTPREGARIQSFPDWYIFDGNKSNITSQIGNAVPPLLSLVLAKQIEKILKG